MSLSAYVALNRTLPLETINARLAEKKIEIKSEDVRVRRQGRTLSMQNFPTAVTCRGQKVPFAIQYKFMPLRFIIELTARGETRKIEFHHQDQIYKAVALMALYCV